jgi:hypothetical protein
MKNKKIISLASMALMVIGFSGCGEDDNSSSNVGSSSGKDFANKVAFKSIDGDSFTITLERNNDNYFHVAYRITDSDGSSIHLLGINSRGKAILTCTSSYSSTDANTYQCVEKYTFNVGKMDDVETRIRFYRDKRYTINMIEYKMGQADKITHIKTLRGEY